jgi:tetratricopeptide (TPR) repeat protein
VHTKNDKNNYPNALHALFPFLNSGSALKQSYLIALKISLDLQQYDLAIKLADACVDQYPHDPDVYFERFEAIIARNMLNWIQYIHANTMDQFLQDGKVKEITKENYKEFEAMLFSNLHTQLRMQEIEAIAKEFPDDYKITMKVISYKLMISYWTRFMITAMCASQDMEDQEIMDMMFHSNSSELFDFSPYFDNALRTRPKRDAQVFCALFVYYFQQNNLEKAEEYAQQILTLRPDMYLGYNALIFIECITNMDKMSSDEYSFDTQREMYLTKIKNTGGEDTDYVFLISDCIKKYHSASKQEKKMLTAQIENYLEKLFSVNQQSEWGIFMQGNYYMLTALFTEAINSYNKIEESENQDIRKSLFNNRAAAKILTGDGTGARRDLDQSLKIDPDKEESLKLLELLDGR